MRVAIHQKGDLVHIPQAVTLVEADVDTANDPQLSIPLRVEETECPKLGVVLSPQSLHGGYVRIYCDGSAWSVKSENIYSIKG